MFSLALVRLLGSRIVKKLPKQFHRVWWKGGVRAKEEPLDIGSNLDHVT